MRLNGYGASKRANKKKHIPEPDRILLLSILRFLGHLKFSAVFLRLLFNDTITINNLQRQNFRQ
jgi:hypothetical protein